MEEEIEKIKSPHPIIVGFGPSFDELTEFRLVVEGTVLQMKDLNMAVHCCFGCYWVFDISYPNTIFLLLEHMVYGLPPFQRMPTTVVTTIDSISKVSLLTPELN